jgi:hypothetical protein
MTRTGVGLALVVALLLTGCGDDGYADCLKREERIDAEREARGEPNDPFYVTPQARCQP